MKSFGANPRVLLGGKTNNIRQKNLLDVPAPTGNAGQASYSCLGSQIRQHLIFETAQTLGHQVISSITCHGVLHSPLPKNPKLETVSLLVRVFAAIAHTPGWSWSQFSKELAQNISLKIRLILMGLR